jgi:hypothetical protein
MEEAQSTALAAEAPGSFKIQIARRVDRPLFTILAVLVILAFGMFSMDRGRHMPGDEGGSYIVVPFQQIVIAAVILVGWRGIRRVKKSRHLS